LAEEAIIKSIAFFSRRDADAIGAEEALDESAFPEGRILTVLHKRKESNPKAAAQNKVKAINEKGSLICDACDFDFVRIYGELGYGFAECHHTVPISALTASIFELTAGAGLHFPAVAPHWARNSDDVSVSFSVTFRTPASERQRIVFCANADLRARGLNPMPPGA